MIDANYWKVDIQYLQKSQLLVVAKSADEALDMVKKNIAEGTEQFAATNAVELTDEEKEWVLKNMQGLSDETEETSDGKVLN